MIRGNINAFGIATGTNNPYQGFVNLNKKEETFDSKGNIINKETKEIINEDVDKIRKEIKTGKYNKVRFSCDDKNNLAYDLFDPSEEIKDYLNQKMEELKKLCENPN